MPGGSIKCCGQEILLDDAEFAIIILRDGERDDRHFGSVWDRHAGLYALAKDAVDNGEDLVCHFVDGESGASTEVLRCEAGEIVSGIIVLKPDPEEMNDDRAKWAGEAVQTFIDATGTDAEDAVSDLLSNLQHFCDRNGVDFEAELERARNNYREETSNGGAPAPRVRG